MSPKALITGISGQDGSYLARQLLDRGYTVYGTSRSPGVRVEGAAEARVLKLDYSQAGGEQVREIILDLQPNEVYHFAADSFVPHGWKEPQRNIHANYGITLELLEAIRHHCPRAKFLNACSREIYGNGCSGVANEETVMQPSTPYGINKAASRWMVNAYRKAYGIFATNAILFNHESPRRGENFVTRKVSIGVARIKLGLDDRIELGSLNAKRDWGYAGDYVHAMWQALQLPAPEEFVLGTGVCHSIRELVETAFRSAGLSWQEHIEEQPELVRDNDENSLAADISKAQRILEWEPTLRFEELVHMMVQADIERLSAG